MLILERIDRLRGFRYHGLTSKVLYRYATTAETSPLITMFPYHHPAEPREERGLAAITSKTVEGGQEGLLHEIFRIGPIVSEARRKCNQPIAVALEQNSKRISIAPTRFPHQVDVFTHS